VYDFPVFGRICGLGTIRPEGVDRDWVVALTEKLQLFVVAHQDGAGLVTRATGAMGERIPRPREDGPILCIDPGARAIGLHIYDSLFKIVPVLPGGAVGEAFNLRLNEQRVLDIVFLHNTEVPTVGVLYEDTKLARHFVVMEVHMERREFGEPAVDQQRQPQHVEAQATRLVALPDGGVLVLGETGITVLRGRTRKVVPVPPCVFTSYGFIDRGRVLLGDDAGTLSLLALEPGQQQQQQPGGAHEPRWDRVGVVSAPSSITYLDNGVVFIGSRQADSQLIRLSTDPAPGTANHYALLDSYCNLGPVVDFCVVDLEQGQGQVISCSGTGKDGSLRIIRNGIGIEEHSSIDLAGIKGMWSLADRAAAAPGVHRYIVQSYYNETRVLGVSGDSLAEDIIDGFDASSPTLHCSDMASGRFAVQVTARGVMVVELGRGLVHQWQSPARINVAAGDQATTVVVALAGGELVLLGLDPASGRLAEVARRTLEHEVACVSVALPGLCAVGMWTDLSVCVVALPSLATVHVERLGGDVIPRSVLLARFEGDAYLLCGLGDGHLLTYSLDAATGALSGRKKLCLGTQPVLLSSFHSKGVEHVFAASDRPTVIYSAHKKLLPSNVNLRHISHVCPFNNDLFPDGLAVATDNRFLVGTIDNIQKIHIRSVPLGETPRRIAHSPADRTLAVITMHQPKAGGNTNPNAFDELGESSLRFFHDQTFELTSSFDLKPGQYELGMSLTAWTPTAAAAAAAAAAAPAASAAGASSAMDTSGDGPATTTTTTTTTTATTTTTSSTSASYFVVGTAFSNPSQPDCKEGRILILSARDGLVKLEGELTVDGAVYDVKPFGTRLVALVNDGLVVLEWLAGADRTGELRIVCRRHGHVVGLSCDVVGPEHILVGDIMASASLYRFTGDALDEVARHWDTLWTVAVHALDDETFLVSENSFNLVTLKRNTDNASDDERSRLTLTGEFHMGDSINRFRRGSLVMQLPEAEAGGSEPLVTHLFATVHGALGVIAKLPEERFQFLLKVQNAIASTVRGVGGLTHAAWRAFANETRTEDSSRFIDGVLIESLLELPVDKQLAIARILDMPLDDLLRAVEDMARIH
jgi:DNA damage-binding protein 1